MISIYKKGKIRIKKDRQMYFLLILAGLQLVIIVPQSLAQKNEFILGAYYSPTISYRNIKSTNPIWNFLTDNLDSLEKPNNNNNFGLNCELQLSKKMNIGIGVGINNLNEKISRDFVTSIHPYETETRNFYNNYKYLKFPIFADYKFIEIKDFSIGLNVGLSTDFLIDHKIAQNSYRNDNSLSEWKYSKITLSALTGLEFEYRIKKFILYTNPFYYQYITSNVKYDFEDTQGIYNNANVSIRQHNYYYGLEFGLKYSINSINNNTEK
jgi:hypothetical protein